MSQPFLIVLLVVAAYALVNAMRNALALRWPRVPAEIVESKVDDNIDLNWNDPEQWSFWPVIRFRYQKFNKKIVSQRVCFGEYCVSAFLLCYLLSWYLPAGSTRQARCKDRHPYTVVLAPQLLVLQLIEAGICGAIVASHRQ